MTVGHIRGAEKVTVNGQHRTVRRVGNTHVTPSTTPALASSSAGAFHGSWMCLVGSLASSGTHLMAGEGLMGQAKCGRSRLAMFAEVG